MLMYPSPTSLSSDGVAEYFSQKTYAIRQEPLHYSTSKFSSQLVQNHVFSFFSFYVVEVFPVSIQALDLLIFSFVFPDSLWFTRLLCYKLPQI